MPAYAGIFCFNAKTQRRKGRKVSIDCCHFDCREKSPKHYSVIRSSLPAVEKPCPLSRRWTSEPIPLALVTAGVRQPARAPGEVARSKLLRPFPETPTIFRPLLIGQEGKGRLIRFKQSPGGVSEARRETVPDHSSYGFLVPLPLALVTNGRSSARSPIFSGAREDRLRIGGDCDTYT